MKKTQEYRPIPESKHSFYSGPFPVSDLGQAWMWSKRGLSLSWVWLVYDKAHQHCTGGNTPNLHNFSRPLFQLLLRTCKRLQARGAALNRRRTKCRLHYSTFSNSSTDRWFRKLLTVSGWWLWQYDDIDLQPWWSARLRWRWTASRSKAGRPSWAEPPTHLSWSLSLWWQHFARLYMSLW